MTLLVAKIVYYMMINTFMNVEGIRHSLINTLSRHLPRRAEEPYETSLRIASILSEDWIRDLPKIVFQDHILSQTINSPPFMEAEYSLPCPQSPSLDLVELC
jgi:hypothetical protein